MLRLYPSPLYISPEIPTPEYPEEDLPPYDTTASPALNPNSISTASVESALGIVFRHSEDSVVVL